MPRITLKSLIGAAVMLMVPLHWHTSSLTHLATPTTGIASELIAFILLESFSNIRPKHFAFVSAMKLCVTPVSTMAHVIVPLMRTSAYMSSFLWGLPTSSLAFVALGS